MKEVNYYRVEIVTKAGLIYEIGNRFEEEKIPVLAENEVRLVLNNKRFTVIEKERSDYQTSINDHSISSSVNDTCWGTSIRYTLYSERNTRKSTIKRHIAEYIQEKFGGFSNINLDFLED